MKAKFLLVLTKKSDLCLTVSRLTSHLSFTMVVVVNTPNVAIFFPVTFPQHRDQVTLMSGGRWRSIFITRKFHTGGNQRLFEYHKSSFQLEGRRSVICSICLLLKALKKFRMVRKGQKMTRVLIGVSRDFNNRRRGRKIYTRSTHFICAHVLQTRKRAHGENKLPFICPPWVKVKWSLSSFVTVDIFQRCDVCHTRDFPFSTATFIILTINCQRRMMLREFYVFCVYLLWWQGHAVDVD